MKNLEKEKVDFIKKHVKDILQQAIEYQQLCDEKGIEYAKKHLECYIKVAIREIVEII